jgi:hypothetical protein
VDIILLINISSNYTHLCLLSVGGSNKNHKGNRKTAKGIIMGRSTHGEEMPIGCQKNAGCPKPRGGSEIKKVRFLNKAPYRKMIWRWIDEKTTLWAQISRDK